MQSNNKKSVFRVVGCPGTLSHLRKPDDFLTHPTEGKFILWVNWTKEGPDEGWVIQHLNKGIVWKSFLIAECQPSSPIWSPYISTQGTHCPLPHPQARTNRQIGRLFSEETMWYWGKEIQVHLGTLKKRPGHYFLWQWSLPDDKHLSIHAPSAFRCHTLKY